MLAFDGMGSVKMAGWKHEKLLELLLKWITLRRGDPPISMSLNELSSVNGRVIHLRTYKGLQFDLCKYVILCTLVAFSQV